MSDPTTSRQPLPTSIVRDNVFPGNSRMAARMRTFDWSRTPLGAVDEWPQSLKTIVRTMLTSRYAMWMAWGRELTFFCNDAYFPTLGVKGDWALGERADLVWEEIWPDIGPRIEKVLHTGEATWDEGLMLFLERSGYSEETYHTFSYSPLADDRGNIAGMLCVVTEETERIIGERRLALLRDVGASLTAVQTEEEIFAAIGRCLEKNSRDLPFTLIYLFEPRTNIARLVSATGIFMEQDISRATIADDDDLGSLQALRTNPQPVAIQNLSDLFTQIPCGPWERPPHQAMVFPIAQQGQEQAAGFLIVGINPYRRFDSDYQGFVSLLVGQVAASLATVRAYEEERRRAEALAELDRAKTVFFSNVSHEFRTPLTLMLGPVEDILAKPEEGVLPENRELLKVVQRNGLRLQKLVNTLLDFTRIEAGRAEASYVPTDLAAYTAELASMFRAAIEKAGMRLLVDCAALSEPAYVDRDMWEKIVLNLLSNAFKFTLEGEIAVTLRERDGQAILTVRDTGVGITEDQLPHIFERFHRVEGTRARTQEGTGIGLALVQELVWLHGGTIDAQSRYGEGTTFTIVLPLGSAHLPADRIAASTSLVSTALRADTFVGEALRWLPDQGETEGTTSLPLPEPLVPSGSTERPRILLADDNADMREYVQRLLQSQYQVVAVSNGEEAFQATREMLPDLVLSDVMMPVLDGFGLLERLHDNPRTRSIPVILLSARAGEEAKIEGLSRGADDYLIKPFSARELLARVDAHLNLQRVRRAAEQAIRESEAQLQTLFDAAPVGIYLIDAEFRIRQVNPAARPTFGNIPNLIGKDLEDVLHILWPQPFADELVHLFRHTLETGESYLNTERIAERLDLGVTEYYEWEIHRIPLPKGQFGVVCFFREISQQVLARQALEERNEEVEALNIRLQRAMTETHHRVKNNLQLISAMIEMQQMSSKDADMASDLTRLSDNVGALAVIHDILTREAKAGNDQESMSSQAVLSRLLEAAARAATGRKLIWSVDDVRLTGKQITTLALVTNELISNAIKHGKGEIEIAFTVAGKTATLAVCDDGPGFPEGFDASRAANTGLELVESIVSWDLGGQVAYENRPEGGAEISVLFPL